jgi:GNAT superfamily N-acetyltransferase
VTSPIVRVRPVDGSDIEIAEQIHAMHMACFSYDIEQRSLDHGHWWVGYEDDEPVCFAGLWPSKIWPDKAGYLVRAAVMPEWRGIGLQRRLVRVRERKARSLRMSFLVSDTCDNPPSSNNLISCGFRMFEPPKRWAVDGSCYWRKDI